MRAPAALYFGLISLVAAAHPRLSLPLRGWAFPYRMNGSFSLYARGTVNFVPTITSSANASALAARGISSLLWASCWNDPYFSKADPSCTGTQCALKNVTAAVETFASHGVVEQKSGSSAIGRGLDECNLNNEQFLNEREVAAQGFREARARDPETIIAAWGANAGDTLFASLMRDGTFDLAMIEGYTYCAGCGDWPASGKCCTVGPITHWAAYQDRLDFARANGYLNRTLFCFGFMIGQSAINPYGWTASSLRTAMVTLKAQYPELAGVIMYGRPPREGFPNATNASTPATDASTFDLIRAANALMLELYPDATGSAADTLGSESVDSTTVLLEVTVERKTSTAVPRRSTASFSNPLHPLPPPHNLSVGRTQLAGATAGRFALFAGGYDAAGNNSAVVDILDSQSWTWSSTARLSLGRGVIAGIGTVAPNGSYFCGFAGGKMVHAKRTSVVDFAFWPRNASAGAAPSWSVAMLSGKPRSMVAAVASVDGAYLFFAGGEYAEDESNKTVDECSDVVDVWDVKHGSWAPFSPLTLSQPRKKLAAAALRDGRIFFAGGYLSGVGNVETVDVWNIHTAAWEQRHNLSTPRFRLQAATVPLPLTFPRSSSTTSTTGASASRLRLHAVPGGEAALFISGQGCDWTCATADLVVAGGTRSDGMKTNDAWSVTTMVHGRYEFNAVVVGGLVVVAGGKQPRPKGIDPTVIDVFDGADGQWRNGTMRVKRSRFFAAGAAAKASSLYGPVAIFAGGNDGGGMNSVEFVPTRGL